MYVQNLTSRLENRLFTKYQIELNSDYKRSVFLAGSGRSGTTWVSSIINYNNEYRDIFEPFHRDKVNIVKSFRPRQYIRPENKDNQFIEPTQSILSGKVRSKWTDRYNRRFISNKRLIKDIRANLFLKWIQSNFTEVPIILLLRHPCAVVYSRLRLGWGNYIEGLFAQVELVEDFLEPFKHKVPEMQTDFEKSIFQWCIENYVPLKQFKKGEIHLAFYENFCAYPKDEIASLFLFLNKKFDDTIFINLSNPSLTSRKESAIITGGEVVDSWKGEVTDKQLYRALEIMSLFGLDKIYSERAMPDVSGAYALMRTN